MKRTVLFLSMMMALCTLMAQSIRKGDTFWSGKVLYTATVTPMDEVLLNGVDARGAKYEIALLKVSKNGEYELKAIDESRPAPYGCYYGARVRLMKRQGSTFLAFYSGEEEIGQILINTPEDLPTMAMQQKYAEQANVLENNGETLMNQKLLSTVKPEILDLLATQMQKKQKTFIQRTNAQLVAFADSKQIFHKDLEPWTVAPPQPIEQTLKDKTTSTRPDVKKAPVKIVDMDDIEEDTTSYKGGQPYDLGVDELFQGEKRVTVTTEDLEEDDEDAAPKPGKAVAPKPTQVETPEPATTEAPEPVKAEAPEPVKAETPVKVEAPAAEVETPVEVPAEAPAAPAEAPAAKNPLKKLKKL